MPFGVKNAPAVFQSLISDIMKECSSFARAYMDDVVIFSKTWKLHKVHVRKVLDSLRGAGLTANQKKCCWGGTSMDFLGHRVCNGQMTIPETRAEALLNYSS